MPGLPAAALTVAGAAAGLALGFWAGEWGGEGGRVRGAEPVGGNLSGGLPPVTPSADLPPPPDLALRYDVGSIGAVPALAAWLGAASPGEIAALAGEVAALPPAPAAPGLPRNRFESWWWRVLFHGWTGVDREGAEDFLEAERQRARSREAREALETDFAIALAWRDAGDGVAFAEGRSKEVLRQLLTHLAEVSPAGLLELVRASPGLAGPGGMAVTQAVSKIVADGGEIPDDLEALIPQPRMRSHLVRAVATSLVSSDPDRAIELARSLPGHDRAEALRGVARALLQLGDVGARFDEVAKDLTPSPQSMVVLVDAAAVKAGQDPVAARAWVEASFAGAERDAAMAGIVGVEMNSDPMAALRYLADHNWQVDLEFDALHLNSRGSGGMGWGGAQAEFRRMLGDSMERAVAAGSGEEILEQLANAPDEGAAAMLVGNLAEAWAEDDPTAASRALAPLGTIGAFQHHVADAIARWAETEPRDAVAFAAGASGRPDRDEDLIQPVFRSIAQNSPERSLALVDEVPDARREAALSTIVDTAIHRSPAIAVQALELLPQEGGDASLWERVGGRYTSADPDAALAWVARVPEGERSEEAHRGVAESLARAAPERAAPWVEALPPGPSREAAIAGLVHGTVRGSSPPFEVALAWANQAAGGEDRDQLTRDVLRRWRREDGEAAAAAAEVLGIPLDE